MAYNDNQQFDLTKPLDHTQRTIMARNLEMIENERRQMNGDRERREQEDMIKKQEESERRLLREREESERRLAEEQARRRREEIELEQEREERLAKLRAREEEESYERQLEFEQERHRRAMAVSYRQYDRYNELYYYYSDRGDYISTDEARLLWQQLNAPSYLEFDPKDDFWEFFLDDEGNLISREQAFELWQPEHCPDYLDYEDGSIWTLYRKNGELISTSEACELWQTEKAGSHGEGGLRSGHREGDTPAEKRERKKENRTYLSAQVQSIQVYSRPGDRSAYPRAHRSRSVGDVQIKG